MRRSCWRRSKGSETEATRTSSQGITPRISSLEATHTTRMRILVRRRWHASMRNAVNSAHSARYSRQQITSEAKTENNGGTGQTIRLRSSYALFANLLQEKRQCSQCNEFKTANYFGGHDKKQWRARTHDPSAVLICSTCPDHRQCCATCKKSKKSVEYCRTKQRHTALGWGQKASSA